MPEIITGRVAIKLGDMISSDQMVPARYMWDMNAETLSKVCFVDYDPEFPARICPGDFIIAGKNFGYGHLHMTGLIAFQKLQAAAVIAESFASGWYRGAINAGFPAIVCPDITKKVNVSDVLEVNLVNGRIANITQETSFDAEAMPATLYKIIAAGGLDKYTRNKYP